MFGMSVTIAAGTTRERRQSVGLALVCLVRSISNRTSPYSTRVLVRHLFLTAYMRTADMITVAATPFHGPSGRCLRNKRRSSQRSWHSSESTRSRVYAISPFAVHYSHVLRCRWTSGVIFPNNYIRGGIVPICCSGMTTGRKSNSWFLICLSLRMCNRRK